MNVETKTPETQTNQCGQRSATVTPRANILETEDGYVLEAEMPGVAKDGLEVTVEQDELVVVGRRTATDTRGSLVYRESRGLDYRRAFEIDPSIDVAKITAKLDRGVLKLHLPKAEAVKPRRIEIVG